jgi:ABC-type multidrug transport system fused ATPase/permease subunit
LGIYAAIAIALGFFTFGRSFMLARFGVLASNKLHRDLLTSILRAPMSFFDTTPMGRVLSRFSRDFYSLDVELADYLDFFLFGTMFVLVSLGAICYATPIFAAAVLPILWVYFRTLNYFREVSRETKRLDSISRSPVYSQFSETLDGLSTIRAYGQTARFITDFLSRVNQNTRASYNNKTADRWLSVRLELVGATIAGLAAVFASRVAVADAGSGSNYASIAGLSLNYAISVTGLLNWCVRSFAQLENAMNACERVLYYTDHIPHEAPATSDALEKHADSLSPPPKPDDPADFAVVASGGKAIHTLAEWPTKGSIVLDNLVMRYREGTPVVLKGLTVSIGGGERIGVVGRTGSGKSSLLLCLLRIVEPELTCDDASQYRAPISIDGVDVLRIGLDDLRTKLGIIPQNPVLFSGTIRSNMDPFDEYTDEEIWSALDRCGMQSAVEEMPGELFGQVAEYGENLRYDLLVIYSKVDTDYSSFTHTSCSLTSCTVKANVSYCVLDEHCSNSVVFFYSTRRHLVSTLKRIVRFKRLFAIPLLAALS